MSTYAVVYPAQAPGLAEAGLGVPGPAAEAPEPEKRICAGIKKDGDPCAAPPKADSDFCVAHQDQDPAAGDGDG